MADRVLVLATSGSGKSYSIAKLNPAETFIINVVGKALPFSGWKKKYTPWTKETQDGNLYISTNPQSILQCMAYVNKSRPEIKNLVIDDLFYVMAKENFDKITEKGYEKFSSMGANFSQIAMLPIGFRHDLIVFYLTHPEVDTDIYGNRVIKTKTIGKLVDNQLNFEGLFDKVLFARPRKQDDKTLEYGFETKTDGATPTKTPPGLFKEEYIPNDLQFVRDSILRFENGEEV